MNNTISWLVKSITLLCILTSGLVLNAQTEYPEVTGERVVWVTAKPGMIGFGQDKDNPAPAVDLIKFLKDSSVKIINVEGAATPNGLVYEASGDFDEEGTFVVPPGKILRGGCDFSSSTGLPRLGFTSILKRKNLPNIKPARVLNVYGTDTNFAIVEGVMVVGGVHALGLNGAGVRLGGNARFERSVVTGAQTRAQITTPLIGGGIFVDGSKNIINSCIIHNNFADIGGGIGVNPNITTRGNTVTNTLIACNSATSAGGGVYGGNQKSQLELRYCTIVSNFVSEPQNATGYFSLANVENSTGNGVSNTIIWGNTRSPNFAQYRGPLFSYSAIENWEGDATTSVISLNSNNTDATGPKFINPLPVASRTDIFVAPALNYRTQTSSVTIGKGINIAGVIYDLDGKTRPQPSQIGAYEANGTNPPIEDVKVCYVREVETGEADGTSWANAFGADKLLDVALSNEYSIVNVAKGTYILGSTLRLSENKRLYGGFTGVEGQPRNWKLNETIITRANNVIIPFDEQAATKDQANAPLVELSINGALLDGFVIDGAKLGHDGEGKAINIFTTNTNASGVNIYGSSDVKENNAVVMQSCRIRNCASQYAMYYDAKSNQYKRDPLLGAGSGLYIEGNNVTVRDLILEGNYGINADGSAIFVKGDSNLVSSVIVANNKSGGLFEGVLYECSATVSLNGNGNRLENALIVNNEAQRAPGVFTSGDALVVNCTMTHNISHAVNHNNGGPATAIFMDKINLTNTIIWNNTAGAVVNRSARYTPPYPLSHMTVRGCNIQQTENTMIEGDGFEHIISEISRDPALNRTPVEVGLFSDWERYSWELSSRSSPCFGTGVADFATRGDITGQPWGDLVDIGAYAYKETTVIKVLYATENGSGTQDGRSWDTAVDSLRLNVLINTPGVEEVRLGAGSYYGYATGKHAFTFPEGIWIRGGFLNGFKQDSSIVKTIISPLAGRKQRVVNFLRRPSQPWHTQIDNLTIANGDVFFDEENGEYEEGGALITIPNLVLKGVTFFNNKAANGGAVLAQSGSVFQGCIFDSNGTHSMENGGNIGNGGGAFATGDVQFIGTTFKGNHAHFSGGGLRAMDQVSIVNCVFDENKASDPNNDPNDCKGGGAMITGEVTVRGTSFFRNESDRYGGGLYARGGMVGSTNETFEIRNCTFGGADPNQRLVYPATLHKGNRALWGAGLYIAENYDVFESRFDYNIATEFGGAIMVGKSEAVGANQGSIGERSKNLVKITRCKIFRNSSPQAAVLYAVASHGAHYFYNNLVTNNESQGADASMVYYETTQPPGRPVSPVGYTTFTENLLINNQGGILDDGNFIKGNYSVEAIANFYWGNSSEEGPFIQRRSYPGSTSDNARVDDRRIARALTGLYYSPFKNPANFDGVWEQDPNLPVPAQNPNNQHGIPTPNGEEDVRDLLGLLLPVGHGTLGEEFHIGRNVYRNTNLQGRQETGLYPPSGGGGCGIRGFNELANWRLTCRFTWNSADRNYTFASEAGTQQAPRQDWSGWAHATFANDPDVSTIRTSPSGRGWLGLQAGFYDLHEDNSGLLEIHNYQGAPDLFTLVDDMDGSERRPYRPGEDLVDQGGGGCPLYLGNAPGCYAYFAPGTNDKTPEEITNQFTLVRMTLEMGLSQYRNATYRLVKDVNVHNDVQVEPNLATLINNGRYSTPSIPFTAKFVGDVDVMGNPKHTINFKVDPRSVSLRVASANEECKGMFSVVHGLVDGIGVRISENSWRYQIYTAPNDAYILHNVGAIAAIAQQGRTTIKNVKVSIDTGITVRGQSVGGILGKDLTQGVNMCFLENCRTDVSGHLVGLESNAGTNAGTINAIPAFNQNYMGGTVASPNPSYAGGIVGRRLFTTDDGLMEVTRAQVRVGPQGSIRAVRTGGVMGTYDGLKKTFFRDCLVDVYGVLQGSQNAAGICATNVTYIHDCFAHFARNSVFTCGTVSNVGGVDTFRVGSKMGGLIGGTASYEPVNCWYAFPDETLKFDGNSSITPVNSLWLTRNFSKQAIPASEDRANSKDIYVVPMRRIDVPVDDASVPVAYYNDLTKNKVHAPRFGLMSQGVHSSEYAEVTAPNAIFAKKQTTPRSLLKSVTTEKIKTTHPEFRDYVKPYSFTVSPTPYSSFSPEFDLFVTSKVRPNPRSEGKVFVTYNGGAYPTRSDKETSYDKESYLPYGSTWQFALGGNSPVASTDADGAKTLLDEAFDAEFVKDVYVGAGQYELFTPITMLNKQRLIGSCAPIGEKGYINNVDSTISAWDHKEQTYIFTRQNTRLVEASTVSDLEEGNVIYGVQFDAMHTKPLVDNNFNRGSNGGGIISMGRFEFLNSLLKNAWGSENGGGLYIHSNTPDSVIKVENVSISNCEAKGGTGGALHVRGYSNVIIQNVLFANNTADTCGAFHINVSSSNPSTILNKSTIVRNKTKTGPFDCYINGLATGVKVSNTLIWGNETDIPIDFMATGVSIKNCAIDAQLPAANIIESSIELSRDNEGVAPRPPYKKNYFTGPRFVNPSSKEDIGALFPIDPTRKWDWRLKYGSPCINTGKLLEKTP